TTAMIERVLGEARGTVVCTHRPVLPTVISCVREAATRGTAYELPRQNPYLAAGEALMLHTTPAGTVVALERHLPNVACAGRRGPATRPAAPARPVASPALWSVPSSP